MQTKTPQEVKDEFAAAGIPVSSWADEHGYRRSDVYRVLNGFSPCKRGIPHEIAVKLGIKPTPRDPAVASR
ncbi:DNA-binding protein [Thauera sinica]|uniref:DNA-binding protein n=1 Tax=Thauera sinica TaxID=2665146 RepID=A0ABW1AXM6_9RHOO|nr:DNA-binding protein [Thauera sp. K11]ATE62571.1 DNA-binding protein [Thauera sp. K11]